jgi:hypothetical protein
MQAARMAAGTALTNERAAVCVRHAVAARPMMPCDVMLNIALLRTARRVCILKLHARLVEEIHMGRYGIKHRALCVAMSKKCWQLRAGLPRAATHGDCSRLIMISTEPCLATGAPICFAPKVRASPDARGALAELLCSRALRLRVCVTAAGKTIGARRYRILTCADLGQPLEMGRLRESKDRVIFVWAERK